LRPGRKGGLAGGVASYAAISDQAATARFFEMQQNGCASIQSRLFE
jgi:hypothetical protein